MSGDTSPVPNFSVQWNGQGGISSRWLVFMVVNAGTPTGGTYHFSAFAICAKVS